MRNDEIIIDSFAGGGGASIGIEMALGRSPDVAINHDPEAVSMHKANHPDTEHHCQNVWQLDPQDVARGRKVGLAWFSPDCKHFSKAKGAAPVKRNVRDLAWVVVLYAQRVKPRVICLENVEEFKTWGPLDENGRPCAAQKGITFKKWINEFKKAGYKIQYRELRACDYGAPTSRKRLFVIARRDGQPIVWPKPTHGDPKAKGFKKSGLKPWRTAADIIDWSQPCPSIFMNSEEVQEWYEHTGQRLKRPLADATMRRIAQGLKRFVFDAEEPFIVTANHQGKGFRGQGLDEPMKTVTAARDATGLVTPYMTKFRKGSHGSPADAPMPTITASSFKKRPGGNPPLGLVVPYLTEHANGSKQRTFNAEEPMRTQCANVKGGHFALVAPTMIQSGYGERPAVYKCGSCSERFEDKHASGIATLAPAECPKCGEEEKISLEREGQTPRAPGLEKPLGTVVACGTKHALVSAFMAKHYGGVVGCDARTPTPTTLTKGSQNQVVAVHMERQFGKSAGNDANSPLGATTAGGGGKTAVVASNMIKLRGTCQHGQETDLPAPTITAGGYHLGEVRAFLQKYYGSETSQQQSCDEPVHTVPTKERFGLVTVAGEEYQVTDIGMRMLTPSELFRAQGFPASYIIDRGADGKKLTKTAQVRMCGNSVCPPIAQAIVAANMATEADVKAAE